MSNYKAVDACDITTMHCGGTITRLYEPETKDQLKELIDILDTYLVIGGGSNMIFPDEPTTMPVIRLGKGFGSIEHQEDILSVGASVSTAALLGYCLRNAITGLEFLAGIPGTIGGALYMNAGTPDKGIMDTVLVAEFMDKQGLHSVTRKEIGFSYRKGGFPVNAVITGARLDVHRSTPEEVRSTMESYIERKRTQPKGYSSGSVFKNPEGTAAGYLIEQAGLKGYRMGGAKISEIHANFIINDENASAADIKSLITLIKTKVKEQSGIELQEEVRIVD